VRGASSRPVIAVFTIPDPTHFVLTLNLAAGLVATGADVRVLAHPSQAHAVEDAAATFVDLFGRFPVEAADDVSRPLPSRYVTHAAHWADAVASVTREPRPTLVVQEVFSVIGRVVATALGVPRVAFKTHHDPDPARAVAELAREARVATDPRCHAGVAVLRERYGIVDASPFSYLTGHSDVLNVLAEPPEYLSPQERAGLEPLAFYGSLPYDLGERPAQARRASDRCRIVVSFGTIIWRYYTAEAPAATSTRAARRGR
jgi:UDP:flavonoid glycosyltransferase YjiC (YdhE family)